MECAGVLVRTREFFTCGSCGLVHSRIYVEPEDLQELDMDGKDQSQVSYGNRMHIADGLGTFMGYYNTWDLKDARGVPLNKAKRDFFIRLKRLNDIWLHVADKEKRPQYTQFRTLNEITATLEIPPQTRDRAAYLFRSVYQELKSKIQITYREILAASLYLAIREHRVMIRLDELTLTLNQQGSEVESKKIIRAAGKIRKQLGAKVAVRTNRGEDYIDRVIEKLAHSATIQDLLKRRKIDEETYFQELRSTVLEMFTRWTHRGGRNPYILAAAMLVGADKVLMAKKKQKELLTQTTVARISEVAEYSLRDHYLKLIKPRFIVPLIGGKNKRG